MVWCVLSRTDEVVYFLSMDFLCPWMEDGKEEVGKGRGTCGEREGREGRERSEGRE